MAVRRRSTNRSFGAPSRPAATTTLRSQVSTISARRPTPERDWGADRDFFWRSDCEGKSRRERVRRVYPRAIIGVRRPSLPELVAHSERDDIGVTFRRTGIADHPGRLVDRRVGGEDMAIAGVDRQPLVPLIACADARPCAV